MVYISLHVLHCDHPIINRSGQAPGSFLTSPPAFPEQRGHKLPETKLAIRTFRTTTGHEPTTMASCPLPILESGDPRLELTLHNSVRNVFVTQSDVRHEQKEKVKYIPVVKESSSRVLEAGVNTLQRTLLLKKKAELDQVDEQLSRKRDEFTSRMEDLANKRSELKLKQQQNRETVMKFEKFVADNEAKRNRALKKYEAAQEENISKQSEIEELTEELKLLKIRQQVLKEKIGKYKIYEDYLLKTLDYFPSSYLDHGSQPSVMSIIRRHEALSVTNRELRKRLGHAEEEVEQGSQQLQSMKREHNVKKLMGIKELSELQSELDSLKEENKQMEDKLLMQHGLSRDKVEEVGRLLMGINNLAEQCYLTAHGPLQNMTVLSMMDMVKEYVTDKSETEKRARRLMELESAETSRTAPTEKKRESIKNNSNKQIRS
ncbi:coiled-coil domain-containing protein 42 homolog [Takifugu flavidus]|nr:coiled-coil domain-containing protein 42 homolog [Takifugu flavidus]